MIVRLVIRRLFFLVFVLIGLSAVTFTLSHLIAGDPARMIAGPRASKEQVDRIREELGYNDPVAVQYVNYVRGLFHGDLGESISTRQPITEDLKRYLPATAELALFAFVLSTVVGVPLGVVSAVRRDSWIDNLSRFVSITGLALPVFWLAIMAQFVFYSKVPSWMQLPAGERLPQDVDPPRTITTFYTVDSLLTGEWSTFGTAVKHLLLPTLVLAYGSLAVITRMVRGSMLEVLNQEYIRTARAKGLQQGAVVRRHALKNALLPAVTSLGLQAGLLLSGVFLVEWVFSWPGIGRYAVTAIDKIDYSAIMATTLIVAATFVLLNLVVDILYLFLDPRISYG